MGGLFWYDSGAKSEDQKCLDLKYIDEEIDYEKNVAMQDLLDNLKENVRYYDSTNKKIKRLADPSKQSLEGHVLFIDEVRSSANQDEIDRMRFFRNLGRALKMRVVLAGTNATAYAGLPDSIDDTGGRYMPSHEAWAVIIFLRRAHDAFNENDHHSQLQPFLREGEPWLVNQSRKATIEAIESNAALQDGPAVQGNAATEHGEPEPTARDIILPIAYQICLFEHPGWPALLVELSGAWLEGNFATPPPFQVATQDFIEKSFFEPCIHVLEGGEPIPYSGIGMARIKQAAGPLRVVVQYLKYRGVFNWIIGHRNEEFSNVNDEEGNEIVGNEIGDISPIHVTTTPNFDRVQDMLQCYVQQSLVREPILAIVMTVVTQITITYENEELRVPQISTILHLPSTQGRVRVKTKRRWRSI